MHDDLDDPTERFSKFKKVEEPVSDEEAKEREKNKLAEKFPGLAIANKVNQEEIELDLDFDNMFTKGDDQDDKKGQEKERKRRSRSRSADSRDHRDNERRRRRDSRSPRSSSRRRHRHRSGSSSSEGRNRKSSRHRERSRRSRSNSRDRYDRRRRSRSPRRRSRSPQHSRGRREHDEDPKSKLVLGEIYRGTITKAMDFGFFVQIDSKFTRGRRCEGLVHVSQIRMSRQRLEKAQDSGFDEGDRVYIKLTQIREDGKLSLSMKEVDQESGEDLNIEKTAMLKREHQMNANEMMESGAIDYSGNTIKMPRSSKDEQMLVGGIKVDFKDAERKGIGAITGISLDSTESKHGANKKQIDPDELWLKSRFQGGGIMKLVDEPSMAQVQDMDECELEEEQAEIELNDEEAPFLANQTTKTGLSLHSVKITKNPDGSLLRAAMAQSQKAKDRKDIRD